MSDAKRLESLRRDLRELSANGRTSNLRALAIDSLNWIEDREQVAAEADERIERLVKALQYAQGGLSLAYDAMSKKCYVEALLHCGHHEARIAAALAEARKA